MRVLMILGVVLIVLGVGGLVFGHFSYTETKPVISAGPIQVNAQQDHTVWIPTVGSVLILVVGFGLVFLGRRKA